MMMLASEGRSQRDGLRMGLWGAAQAISFALGGFLGTVAVDLSSIWLDNSAAAYGLVFCVEAAFFVWAASLIFNLDQQVQDPKKSVAKVDHFALESSLRGVNP